MESVRCRPRLRASSSLWVGVGAKKRGILFLSVCWRVVFGLRSPYSLCGPALSRTTSRSANSVSLSEIRHLDNGKGARHLLPVSPMLSAVKLRTVEASKPLNVSETVFLRMCL